MGMFHVFVDGPIDESPEAVRRLAEAMHQRYGLLTSDIVARLAKGRFRVKGNIDEKTANVYARDLQAIGARVTVEPSDGERDRSGLINLPPVEAGRAEEPTPVGGVPRTRSTSGAPRPASGKIGPVIERTKSAQDDRRDQLSPRGATTKAPLGVDRPAAASNPPPLSTAPTQLGERPSGVALGAAGPSNAGISVSGPSVDLDLGAAGSSGDPGPRHAHVDGGDLDLGAPGATIPPRYTPVPASAFPLGASGVSPQPLERGGAGITGGGVALGAPGATSASGDGSPYPVGPDGAPLPPRSTRPPPTPTPPPPLPRTTAPPPARTSPPYSASSTSPPPYSASSTSPPPYSASSASPPPYSASSASSPPPYGGTTPPPLGGVAQGRTPLPPSGRTSQSSLPPPTSALPPRSGPTAPPTSALPPRSGATAPPMPPNRASAPALPNRPGAYSSGLAAAYATHDPSPPANELGALEQQPKDLAFALAALDHNEDIAPPEVSFAPAPPAGASAAPMLPASIGPIPSRPTPPVGAAPRAHDPFAPPDAHEAEIKVELAEDRQRVAGPIGNNSGTAPARPSTPSTPLLQRKPMPTSKSGVTRLPSSHGSNLPRWHFAAGIGVAIVLGFVPAHLIASARESTADRAIDAEIIDAQAKADTVERYNGLDSMRAAQESRKKSEHRNIALVSLLIWAVAGAGVGYVWFRQVPWDRVLKS